MNSGNLSKEMIRTEYSGRPIAIITVLFIALFALIGAGTFIAMTIINHFSK